MDFSNEEIVKETLDNALEILSDLQEEPTFTKYSEAAKRAEAALYYVYRMLFRI